MDLGGGHLPDVAVYFASLSLTCACFLLTSPTSPIYTTLRKIKTVSPAIEVGRNGNQYISLNMCFHL